MGIWINDGNSGKACQYKTDTSNSQRENINQNLKLELEVLYFLLKKRKLNLKWSESYLSKFSPLGDRKLQPGHPRT